MDCSRCGLSNLPYFADCSFCNTPLRDPAEAQKRKLEWEVLSPALRDEFSRNYQRDRERFDEWHRTLKRDRRKHLILGSVFYGAVLTFVMVWVYTGSTLAVLLGVLADLLWGAGLGWVINRSSGGEYRSMAAFGVSFVLSNGLKIAGGMLGISLGSAFLLLSGFLMMLVLGYLFGLNMSLVRSIR